MSTSQYNKFSRSLIFEKIQFEVECAAAGGVSVLQITQITIKSHHLHLITDSFSILHVFRSVQLLLHDFTTNSHNFTQIYEDSPIVRKIPQVYEKSEGIAHFYEKSERFPCFTLIVYNFF